MSYVFAFFSLVNLFRVLIDRLLSGVGPNLSLFQLDSYLVFTAAGLWTKSVLVVSVPRPLPRPPRPVPPPLRQRGPLLRTPRVLLHEGVEVGREGGGGAEGKDGGGGQGGIRL